MSLLWGWVSFGLAFLILMLSLSKHDGLEPRLCSIIFRQAQDEAMKTFLP